jgi:hypothetical protein
MKMVKSLILGSAAGLVAIAGAQAADLPVKAKPVQYVKICSLYGAGFYYIPGTDTCIKIGGYVRAELNYQAGGSFNPVRVYNFDSPARDRTTNRVRGGITVDVRSQTEYGTLRAYAMILPTSTNDGGTGGSPYDTPGVFAPAIFIQFAGFTAGKTASFFDFDLQPYSNQTNIWGSNQAGNGISVFAYTAQFGNGMSASLSIEDQTSRRTAVFDPAVVPAIAGYGGRRWPDLVANLRIDQAWGSAQIMGAIHDTYSIGTAAGTVDDVGWAIGGGIKFNVPQIGKGDYLIAQVAYGEGAMNYIGSNFAAGGAAMLLTEGFPAVTSAAVGYVTDAVQTGPGTLALTKGWSITGGYEHVWNPNWKTSIYGAYGTMWYSDAASNVINAINGSTGSASWELWQVGSRTVWTPVQNLDLSLEVLYTDLSTSSFRTVGVPTDSKGYVSGIFRVQRNFWP